MVFDDESAKLVSDLILTAWFVAFKWSAGSEPPEIVEERQGDFMLAAHRAGRALQDAGFPLPDISQVYRRDFHFDPIDPTWPALRRGLESELPTRVRGRKVN